MGSEILCTICARGGSQGVKNKNIRELAGKPLIAYTIETAKAAGIFEHIVISTDSDAIAEAAETCGAEVFFRRPDELATSTAAKIPVIRHALLESEKYYGRKFTSLMDLDATSPLRSVDDIMGAWNLFIQGGYDNVITAMPSRKSPYFNIVEVDENGNVHLSKTLEKPIVRRQDAPKCFDMNASIYIWKRETLLGCDSVITENTGLYIMPEERSIDIDTELDFAFVEFLFSKRLV
ncbi:cytidylyltransferase domain-containing protein [Gracilinema caldarium]|uniref:N-acylneuraminate cytidylyltransferase n=1 Tax=Gracilinema caldarium (strain ATCC 51460 / DSM 7334 / H1) TaxID=744872 RepID=F8F023_GRAC1|nr:acylneuraminate cytidylyltransferase family protein [Gracilinema caldarium]AEJ18676.1 N-acylneuraminate cytidylyltransferase [Gracilinema caldarium DSM 7334]